MIFTNLSPRWILVAKKHIRGCEPVLMKFNNLDELVLASLRLRGIGYSLIRTFPAKMPA